MSLRKYNINRESEEVLEEVVPAEVEKGVVGEVEAAEAVEDHNEAVEELNKTEELIEEADEIKEELDEKIEELQEVISEAETKAEETGEAPEVAEEEVVAAQEALKYYVKVSGFQGYLTTVSKEDIASNPYEALKVTQEGLKEIKDYVVMTGEKLAGKIKEISKNVLFTLKTLLPTKRNKVLKLQAELKKISALTGDMIPLETEFVNTNRNTLGGIVALFGEELGNLAVGIDNYIKTTEAIRLKIKTGNFKAGLENLDMLKIFTNLNKFPEISKINKRGYKYVSVIGASVANNNINMDVVLYDDINRLETDKVVVTREFNNTKFSIERAIKMCDIFISKYERFSKALLNIDEIITGTAWDVSYASGGVSEKVGDLEVLYNMVINFGVNIDSIIMSSTEYIIKYGAAVVAASKAAPAEAPAAE